jgi:outer membrane protein TolC
MVILQAFIVGMVLLAAGSGFCDSLPGKIVMSRGFAVAMALGKNPDLRIEALNTVMAETDASRSRGQYDLLLNAGARGGETKASGDADVRSSNSAASLGLARFLSTGATVGISTQTGSSATHPAAEGSDGADWQSSVGLTVVQPLLKNAGKEVTEINITLADNALRDSVDRFRVVAIDTVSAVITSYNHLYVLRKVLESRGMALDSARKFLDEIRTRKLGPLKKLEIANAEYALNQRRKDLVEAERNVSDHEASFRYLIGMEERSQIIPSEPPSRMEPPGTEEQAVSAALESRADLRQLRRALQMSQLQERVAKRQSLPDVSLRASGGLTGAGGSLGDSYQQVGKTPGTFWSAGLELSVPLGNTYAINDYRRRKAQTEQLQNQINALSWLIRNDVEADLRALISARLQIQTADASAQFAVQRLEEYRKNNVSGSATVQDVINAESDLIVAANAQWDALESFANGVTRLWRDTGELLERQEVHVDASDPRKLMESQTGAGK